MTTIILGIFNEFEVLEVFFVILINFHLSYYFILFSLNLETIKVVYL